MTRGLAWSKWMTFGGHKVMHGNYGYGSADAYIVKYKWPQMPGFYTYKPAPFSFPPDPKVEVLPDGRKALFRGKFSSLRDAKKSFDQ